MRYKANIGEKVRFLLDNDKTQEGVVISRNKWNALASGICDDFPVYNVEITSKDSTTRNKVVLQTELI